MVLDLLHRIDLSNAETSLSNPKIFCQGTGHHGAVHGFSGCYRMLSASSFLFSLQCEGKAYNDRSDIWAMGCILYEMACLQKTFEGSNLPALVNKIMKVGFIHGSESLAFAFPCLRVWWCNVFVQHEAQCTLDTSMQISRQFLWCWIQCEHSHSQQKFPFAFVHRIALPRVQCGFGLKDLCWSPNPKPVSHLEDKAGLRHFFL